MSKPLTGEQKKELIKKLRDQISNFPSQNEETEERVDKENQEFKNYQNAKKADLHINLGYILADFPEKYEQAITEFLIAIKLFTEINKEQSMEQICSLMGSIASVYFTMGDFSNAVSYYKKSFEIFNSQKVELHTKEVMIGKKGLGLSLLHMGEELKGVNNLLDAAKLCVKSNDINNYMEIITILKEIYVNKRDWEMIIELETKALQILENMKDKNHHEIVISHLEIGLALTQLKRYFDSLSHFHRAVNAALESRDNNLIYRGIIMVAETYFHLRQIENSKEEYLKALSLALYIGNKTEIQKTKLVLSALGASKEEINKAIETGEEEEKEKIE
ncbi:MAG: hypothetical protein ACTSWY_07695 [Promethearchaeota archaeon]